MLKTITDFIQSIPEVSFSSFYTNYVMEMQDIGIESEMYAVSKLSDLHPIDFESNICSDISELMFYENEEFNKS